MKTLVTVCALCTALTTFGAAHELTSAQREQMNNFADAKSAAQKGDGQVRVLFLGNSTALHGVACDIGWSNRWGMAASAEAKDYVHLTTRGIERNLGVKVDMRVRNVAGFERGFRTWNVDRELKDEIAFKPDYVICGFGGNARNLDKDDNAAAMGKSIDQLLGKFRTREGKTPKFLVCGSFWPNRILDEILVGAAARVGAPFVKSDFAGREGMWAKGRFWHKGVEGHPGDAGMAERARRILETLFPQPLPVWKGEALAQWKGNEHVADLACANGVLRGKICGRDSQLTTTLDPAFTPKNNRFFVFRLRTNSQGGGQIFWTRIGDAGPSETRQQRLNINGDGQWHDYRIRTGWTGPGGVRTLRFDFPADYAADTWFEFSEIGVAEIGEELPEINAKDVVGIAFSLKMPKGLHYGRLEWKSDEAGGGEFGFSTATDGERHGYWFDLRKSKIRNWGPKRGQPAWVGSVSCFASTQLFGEKELKLENQRFVSAPPDLPADPVITSADSSEAIPRAGRPFVLEAVVRNFGTRPVTGMKFTVDGLPAGVKALNPELLTPPEPLPGSDGTESIDDFSRPPLPHERVFRFRFSDFGVGTHRLALTLTADGVAPRRVEVPVEVKPSLGLAKADYPPEPRPVKTGRYEIGALLFPGWTLQKWHAVWSHDAKRKPLLGWYDETNPETIDWQIKHLVENGISFVSVDWYWRNGKRNHTHWQEAFAKAKYRRYLKWHLMWDNGYNSAEDQEVLAKYWCEHHFNDPQYHRIDGRPVVAICSPQGMESRMKGQGGAKRLVEITQRIAREHGFKGVYFVAMRGMGQDSADTAFLRQFADYGFDLTTVYGFRGGIPGTAEGAKPRRSFTWMADVSLDHWRQLKRNGTLPFWPSLSTGYDDRPWRGERVLEIYDYNAESFRRICRDAKTFADESGVTTFLAGPLDEWGEGSIGYPNREHGFAILEAIRDTFGEKPAEGWPVNYAPEDVGLVCPYLYR